MLYCILTLVLAILIGVITYMMTYDDENGFAAGMSIFIISGVILLINNNIGAEERPYKRTAYEISSLEVINSTNYTGAFILGTGSVGSSQSMKYVFFINDENGKQLKTINAEGVYLIETNQETPKLQEEVKQFVRKTNWIDTLWGTTEKEKIMLETIEKQTLIIPENTIKIEYNVEI